MRTNYGARLLLAALSISIIGSIYYLSIPTASTTAPAVPAAVTAKPDQSKEGSMQTVMTPPKTFNGRRSPEAASAEEYSSNPKRDPSEQLVLDISAQRGITDEAKVQRLLGMIPTLPPDAQTLAMENAAALIPDKDYLKQRNRLFQLANTPEMREAVMDDSLSRGEEIRLPNLLEMMRTSTSQDEKQEIREILEAYLDQDYGPHPAQWEAPLRRWVAENSNR
jgi:hypothetical protein